MTDRQTAPTPRRWPGWLLIALGILSWLASATAETPSESTAEALGRVLGRMFFSIGLVVWGVVLLRRAARREREQAAPHDSAGA